MTCCDRRLTELPLEEREREADESGRGGPRVLHGHVDMHGAVFLTKGSTVSSMKARVEPRPVGWPQC